MNEGSNDASSAVIRARWVLWGLLIAGSFILLTKGVIPTFGNTEGDFANYYTAARLVADGVSWERAYLDYSWFQRQMDRYGIKNQVGGFIPHPPPASLVFLPLTRFDPLTARSLFTLVNVGLLVLNVALLSRISGLSWILTAVLFLGTGYGLLNNFLFGQLYLLLTASILLALYLAKAGCPAAAGVSLGALIPVKYFGVFFLLFFVWKREWRVVTAAAATVFVVLAASFVLTDYATFETFVTRVLPRHLRGEIQDPYAVAFQSWNSLFRRLFLYEETLSPDPLVVSPVLFSVVKNATSGALLALSLYVLVNVRFSSEDHQSLFQMGFIPLSMLLLSPGGATYHFLLLSLSATFFVRILLDSGRPRLAVLTACLYGAVNLPHFVWIQKLTAGSSLPLAYSRLWLLLALFTLVIVLFRSSIPWNRTPVRFGLVALGFVGLGVGSAAVGRASPSSDGARRLSVTHPDYLRHHGLILDGPNLGRHRMVFSYCALLDDRYVVFSEEGRAWTPPTERNYYQPDLGPDDRSLLVETVENGRLEIWLSKGPGEEPRFVIAGRHPNWHPDGNRFVFEQEEGALAVYDLKARVASPLALTRAHDPAFSPSGDSLAYWRKDGRETRLHRFDLPAAQDAREEVLYRTSGRLESPRWSSDGRTILFSLVEGGNEDIWALPLGGAAPRRITWDPAVDRDPVWDEAKSRIIFTSDRGRGLGCTTLFGIAIPEHLR